MRKIFGIFVIGVTTLSLASCKDDNELEKAFKTAFSNNNLNSIESLSDGSYTYKVNAYSDTKDFDGFTYLESAVTKIDVSGSATKIDYSMTSTNINSINNTEMEETSNILIEEVNDEITSVYIGGNYSSKQGGAVTESYTYVKEFLDEYSLSYDALTNLDAGNYDYVSVTVDGVSITSDMIALDILDYVDYNIEEDLGSEFNFELSDFLVDDFTTYESISSTQAYANIEFKLFDEKGADVTRNILADAFGLEPNDENIDFLIGLYQLTFPDISMDVKLGINPSTGAINYFMMDMGPFYEALGLNDYSNMEFAFVSSEVDMTLPANRVLDGSEVYIDNKLSA